jgi:peptidoglycan/LPS O-acetylase OafA/YrhL
MHRSRILLLVATLVGLIALFLPFTTFSEQGTYNGFDGYAWPVLVLVGTAAGLALFGDRAESMRTPVAVTAIGMCGLSVVLAAFKLADAASAADTAGAALGAGAWVLLGACVLALAGAVASLTRRI